MARASESKPDLWVATQSAVYYVDGDEVIAYPGLVVTRDSKVIELGFEDDLPLSQATVLITGRSGEHGSEMTRLKRARTRPAADPW